MAGDFEQAITGITAGFDLILYWLAQRFGHDLALKVAADECLFFAACA